MAQALSPISSWQLVNKHCQCHHVVSGYRVQLSGWVTQCQHFRSTTSRTTPSWSWGRGTRGRGYPWSPTSTRRGRAGPGPWRSSPGAAPRPRSGRGCLTLPQSSRSSRSLTSSPPTPECLCSAPHGVFIWPPWSENNSCSILLIQHHLAESSFRKRWH